MSDEALTAEYGPEIKRQVDFTEDRLFPLGWGLIYRVVCAPKDWDDDRIGDDLSMRDPPGTSVNRWVVSDNESAANHKQWAHPTNRKQCPDCEGSWHVLMNC